MVKYNFTTASTHGLLSLLSNTPQRDLKSNPVKRRTAAWRASLSAEKKNVAVAPMQAIENNVFQSKSAAVVTLRLKGPLHTKTSEPTPSAHEDGEMW